MSVVGMNLPASQTADFDEDLFETRLEALKDTQDGIQQMSAWCLQHRGHHKKIVACWLNVFKRVRVEHRLILFYLANDVIQYSKRKRYEFVESWATALQRATTMVRDEKVKSKILRIFKIWEQREIYNEEYLSDLSGLLNINPPKKSYSHTDCEDYQNGALIDNIRECVELSEATDRSFKKLPKNPIADIETIKQQIKDKSHSEDVEKEIERYKTYIDAYNKNLSTEIKSRKSLMTHLETAMKFYSNQRGEVKVVVSAYRNFGSRIKLVKKKLDEITPSLPSPIPSPDINAPSPEPDADIHLPGDQSPISINMFKSSSINGYSSYLDGKLPFDINDFKRDSDPKKNSSQPIEVIGSRSDDETFNSSLDFYKPDPLTPYSSSTNVVIPGLGSIPMPPAQSEYTSLARQTQQYGNALAHGGLFGSGSTTSSTYSPFLSNYNQQDSGYIASNVVDANNSYTNNGSSASNSMQSLLPPPPVPPTALSGNAGSNTNSNSSFNTSWDSNMLWPSHDTTSPSSNYARNPAETPVSPQGNISSSLEFSEQSHNSSVGDQDVDHRQLHLPAFGLGPKSAISKDKTRQLDIDHRNLISLTGSPGLNDGSKKAWPAMQDQGKSGDMDYRKPFPQPIPTLDKGALPTANAICGLQGNGRGKSLSPLKGSKDGHKDDNSNNSGYFEQSDMVVDMDLSDEEDDALKDSNNSGNGETDASDRLDNDQMDGQNGDARIPLLSNPPPSIWDPNVVQMNMPCYPDQNMSMPPPHHQHQQQQDGWNSMPNPGMCIPPPPGPRPNFGMQPYPYANPNANSRGRGRGGNNGPNGPIRNHRPFQRSPRGGGGGGGVGGGYDGGNPFYSRGGRGAGGGGMRGSFRGKFRGNNTWI